MGEKQSNKNGRLNRNAIVAFCILAMIVSAVGGISLSGNFNAPPPQPLPSSPSRAVRIRSFVNPLTLSGRILQYSSLSTAEDRALQLLIDDDNAAVELQMMQHYALATMWFQNGLLQLLPMTTLG